MDLAIVYLDDSDLSLEAVKDGLEPLGIEVTTHRDPLTIYAVLLRANPALLLLDAQMPTLEGKTICRLVKRHLPALPIALFSTQATEALSALVDECGADGYIVKSDRFDEIASDIRRIALRVTGESP